LVLEPAAGAACHHSVFWQVMHHTRFAAVLSLLGGDRLRQGVEVDVLLDVSLRASRIA